MDKHLRNYIIEDAKSLAAACDVLHDATMDLESVEFDEGSGNWSATFKREFFEAPELARLERKILWFRKYSFPYCRSRLEFSNVISHSVDDKAKIQIFPFNEVNESQDGSFVFDFCEGMSITLKFSGPPKGILRDLEILEERGSIWGWHDSNPATKGGER